MFLKNTISVFLMQVLALVLAFCADAVLSRTLGPLGRGQYSVISAAVLFVWLISNIGINNASVYFTAIEYSSKARIISGSLYFQFITACVGSLILYLVFPFIKTTVIKADFPQVNLILVLVPLTALLNGIQSILLGLGEIQKYNISRILTSSLQLLFFLLLWVSLQMNIGAAVIVFTVSLVIASLLGIFWLWRLGGFPRFTFSVDLVSKFFTYGLKSWGGMVFQFLNYRMDVFIVNFFVGPTEVGYYVVAVGLAETIWYIPNSIATVLFPQIASSNNASHTFTPKVVRSTSLITVIAILCLAIVNYPVIMVVYGNQFIPAVMPLLALLPGIYFVGIAKVLASDLNGRGKPHCGTSSAFISILFTLIFDFLLIPRFGIMGAAIASSISYVSAFVVLVFFYYKYVGDSLKTILVPQKEDFVLYFQALKTAFGKYWVTNKE